jgi:hypothetical protein
MCIVCLSLANSSFEVRHIITKMFGILTEKKRLRDVFLYGLTFIDPFELVCPFSNFKLLVASRKKWFVSFSEFIINKTTAEL